MLLLSLLSGGLCASLAICIYDQSTEHCPHDATRSYTIHNWDAYRADEGASFALNGVIQLTYHLCANLSERTPIDLRLPATGDHNVTFRAVGAGAAFVFIEDATCTRARYFRFFNCVVRVNTESSIYFYDLHLEGSTFVDPGLRIWAYNTLVVDLFSAAFLPSLSAASVTLLFAGAFWPPFPQVVRLSRLVTVSSFAIAGIETQLSMRLFGDMYVFQRPGFAAPVYVDAQEAVNRPRVLLDHASGQLTVFCDYFVPKFYDPPVLEFELSRSERLIFADSLWPFWFSNLVLVTTRGRAGQQLWINTPLMPLAIRSYWNVSETFEPVGDASLPGEYLSELTIGINVPEVTILGRIQAQASDIHFDSSVRNRASLLTVVDFVEYGMRLRADAMLDTGVFPHILNKDMTVRFIMHEKHESLNTSSKFGGVGRWEWIGFPYAQGSTGVGNLFVNSSQPYDIFYGHKIVNHQNSPLCELDAEKEQQTTITFSDPHNPILHLRPHYFFGEWNRLSNEELEIQWPTGKSPDQISGYPALIYFASVTQDFQVIIEPPDYGAPGFESSTFFFEFIWDASHKAIRMVRKDGVAVADRNYRFCYNPHITPGVCPPDYAVVTNTNEFPAFVGERAHTLRIALADDFNYNFNYFISTQINIRIFAPGPVRAILGRPPKLTVPHTFLAGSQFGEIHLHNLTLAFSHVADPKVELSEIVHLDLHNVTWDDNVINSLQPNGCRDTPYVEADPISFSHIHDHCVPDHLFLDEGTFHRIEFSQNTLTLYQADVGLPTLPIKQTDGRPYEIELYYHANDLQLDVATGTSSIPRTSIWMPDIPGNRTIFDLPNYTFGSRWTRELAANLTIDNLLGRFYIATAFVPFRPGGIIRIPSVGPGGIRIYWRPGYSFADARVYWPFPNYARINPDGQGVILRYQDIEIAQPMAPTGNIEHAIFAGEIRVDRAAGMNIVELEFDKTARPTLNIDFRLQGGLPRLYLGTIHSPMDPPVAVNLVHRGESEKAFIKSHVDFFRVFSHEIICGNGSLPCEHWNIVFKRNEKEDTTKDHDHGTSVLRTVCRPQVQGLLGKCLALEIDEYYFPVPTLPPLPPRPHPTDAAKTGYTANSGIGKGVGIGIGVGAVLAVAAIGGIFWWFRVRSADSAIKYDSTATYTAP